jgi:hypothetical protein
LVLEDEYVVLSTEIRTLYDNIMILENDGINTSHFTGLAPKNYNFIVGKLTLEFANIFCMFNIGILGASLIRLWDLCQTEQAAYIDSH